LCFLWGMNLILKYYLDELQRQMTKHDLKQKSHTAIACYFLKMFPEIHALSTQINLNKRIWHKLQLINSLHF
jgi:hypothetical protein